MDTRAKFENYIVRNTKIENVNGYVRDYRNNVLDIIDSSEYENDLMEGAGSELRSKFSALYSSSALVVNCFSSIKRNFSEIEFLGYKNFTNARFEREFYTGLGGTPPTLDFCLENNNIVIGVESKYLELLRMKEAKFTDSYFKSNEILPEYLDLITLYHGKKGFLDSAQLIKHCLGLSRYARINRKKAILVYVYWKPENYSDYQEYYKHEQEIMLFKQRIKSIESIQFVDMTYKEIWNHYLNNEKVGNDIRKVWERYNIRID